MSVYEFMCKMGVDEKFNITCEKNDITQGELASVEALRNGCEERDEVDSAAEREILRYDFTENVIYC